MDKQTAVASKDKGFFDKAFALSNTYNISLTPTHFSIARFARDVVCLVCVFSVCVFLVCVCVCVCLVCVCVYQITLSISHYGCHATAPKI